MQRLLSGSLLVCVLALADRRRRKSSTRRCRWREGGLSLARVQ